MDMVKLKQMKYDNLKEILKRLNEKSSGELIFLQDRTTSRINKDTGKQCNYFHVRLIYKGVIIHYKEYELNDELDIVVAKENAYYVLVEKLFFIGAQTMYESLKGKES